MAIAQLLVNSPSAPYPRGSRRRSRASRRSCARRERRARRRCSPDTQTLVNAANLYPFPDPVRPDRALPRAALRADPGDADCHRAQRVHQHLRRPTTLAAADHRRHGQGEAGERRRHARAEHDPGVSKGSRACRAARRSPSERLQVQELSAPVVAARAARSRACRSSSARSALAFCGLALVPDGAPAHRPRQPPQPQRAPELGPGSRPAAAASARNPRPRPTSTPSMSESAVGLGRPSLERSAGERVESVLSWGGAIRCSCWSFGSCRSRPTGCRSPRRSRSRSTGCRSSSSSAPDRRDHHRTRGISAAGWASR